MKPANKGTNQRVAVARVDRSPMNARRWLITLVCGHELWKTAAGRPTSKAFLCSTCTPDATRTMRDPIR